MNQKDTKLLAILGCIILVGAVIATLVTQRPALKQPVPQDAVRPAPAAQKPAPALQSPETVTIQTQEGKLLSVDIANGTRTEIERPFGDLTKFVGLPVAFKDKTRQLENVVQVLSDDKSQAIVRSVQYDLTKEQSDFDGSYPVLETKEFICIRETKACSGSDMLARADKAVGDESSVWWWYFDSKDGFLLGNPSGEGIGNAGPYYVFMIATGKLRKTEGVSQSFEAGGYWYVHYGALSPSRRWIVLEELKKDGSHLLHIYNPRAIEKSVKSIPLRGLDETAKSAAIETLAWFPNEGSLLIGTDDSFYTLDLSTGKAMRVYTDTTQDSSLLKWDRNVVRISAGGRYAVFTDFFTAKDAKGKTINGSDIKAIDIFGGGTVKTIYSESSANLPIEEFE